MTIETHADDTPKGMLWTGRVLSGVLVLFMLMDITIKLIRLPVVEETMAQLGYPAGLGFGIGVMEAIILVLYVIPRTSVLGAILFTGVMGGAMATHLRIGDPWVSHTLFGLYLGLFAWGGLYLRDSKLRALIPFRKNT